jgi:type II secretory pathway component PulC
MINKFKDFLKTRLGKKNRDLSDQEGVPDDTNPSNNFEISDKTGETSLANTHESLKDKISGSFSGLRSKIFKPNFSNWKLPDAHKKKKSFEGLTLLSPNLTKNFEHLLSRQGRETIHQVSLVLLISAMTYFFGKTTALFLKGTPQIDTSKTYSIQIDLEKDFNPSTLSQVRSINIFRTNTGLGSKKTVADTKCEKAQQTSNLPIKLINTVVLQDSVKSLASVQVRGDRSLQEVREGEQISNLAKIFKITRLQMLVKNLENGICEAIESDKGRESRSPISVMSASKSREFKANKKISGIENDGNKFSISKNFLDEKIKDISSILTQAKAIKIQNPDGTMSFKLTEMDPEGLFSYLGLQDQDIITSINGRPIYDMNEVMGLFGKIKNLDKLQLGLKREGSESVLDYNIKK